MRTARQLNFHRVEDSKGATQKIHNKALLAVKRAAKENRRHGLAANIIRGNQVNQVAPGRKEAVVAT